VADAIDTTMLRIAIWSDAVGDAGEHDRLRAHRVVEYIRDRFPVVRYNDAPEDFDDAAGRRLLHEGSKGKVV
jgi:hypothetical protein